RQNGKLTLSREASSARARGTGLRAEYFGNKGFTGEALLERQDPNIWFGPIWGAFRELKARNGWFKSSESPAFDPGSCLARWTGFLEAPLTEEFVFVVYTYGQLPA